MTTCCMFVIHLSSDHVPVCFDNALDKTPFILLKAKICPNVASQMAALFFRLKVGIDFA